MSGVEAAGILLGVFPLLISAAEYLKEGFEPLRKWKRFRTEFLAFIYRVDIEKTMFRYDLERFLFSAGVPEGELLLFMNKPDYEGWRRPELVEIFQSRLGIDGYNAYVGSLETMKILVKELENLLCENGKADWADEGSSRWDYELKRIRFSFSERGNRTLKELETHNRKLRELLESSDKLETMKDSRRDRNTSWGNIFDMIRQQAASLHTAIKKSWTCGCSSPHEADLRLQCRSTIDASSQFNIAFETPHMSDSPLIRRREVIFNAKFKECKEESSCRTHTPARTPSAVSISVAISHTPRFRPHFEAKSTSSLNVKSRPAENTSVSVSSIGSVSKISSRIPTSAKSSNLKDGEFVAEEGSSRNWLSKLGRRSKKTVQIQLPEEQVPALLLPTQIAVPTDPAAKTSPQSTTPIQSPEIHDLCSIIREFRAESPGYLIDDQHHQFEVQLVPDSNITSSGNGSISLDALLKSSVLLRRQRHLIAFVLASSFLQLQNTPWLTEKLDKRDILFFKRGLEVVLEHPYIRHSFGAVNSIQPSSGSFVSLPTDRFAARNSLSSLGIVLLELCFGQVIEDQPLRKAYLGADGTPNDGTDYMTARDWAELVCEQEPEFDSIIKRCVRCAFEEKADWSNQKFTAAVYCNIVQPLEKINESWTPT